MIGKRMRQAREAAGLTQREVAIAANVTTNTVSDLERGENTNPALQTVQALAKALGVSVAELVGEEVKAS